MQKAGLNVTLYKVVNAGHGFGNATQDSTASLIEMSVQFLEKASQIDGAVHDCYLTISETEYCWIGIPVTHCQIYNTEKAARWRYGEQAFFI